MLLIGCVSDLLLCQVVLKCGGGEKGGGGGKKSKERRSISKLSLYFVNRLIE